MTCSFSVLEGLSLFGVGGEVANIENLKMFGSEREPRGPGRKGGKKSGVVRRQKRDMRQVTRILLDLPATEESAIKILESMGIPESEHTNLMVVVVRIFQELLATGNVRAAEFLRDTAGYDPRMSLEEKRFEAEMAVIQGGSDIVNDWIDSIPDVPPIDKEGEGSGDEETAGP